MKLLTKKQQKSYENTKIPYFCVKNLKINMLQIKTIEKLGTIVTMKGNIEVLHMAYVI